MKRAVGRCHDVGFHLFCRPIPGKFDAIFGAFCRVPHRIPTLWRVHQERGGCGESNRRQNRKTPPWTLVPASELCEMLSSLVVIQPLPWTSSMVIENPFFTAKYVPYFAKRGKSSNTSKESLLLRKRRGDFSWDCRLCSGAPTYQVSSYLSNVL